MSSLKFIATAALAATCIVATGCKSYDATGSCANCSCAKKQADRAVWVLCRFDLKPDVSRAEYIEKTKSILAAVRAEKGCCEYRLLGDATTDWDKPQRFGERTFWMLAYPVELGTRHPLTIVTNEIIDIFSRMGFVLADGPEVEDDLHVFTKMNFAADHPARDMQDTFFVSQHPNDVTKNILLRSPSTQTGRCPKWYLARYPMSGSLSIWKLEIHSS